MASPDRYYRAAVICGLAPLTAGTGIFLLWLVVGWTWLMFAGAFTVCAGVASAIAGASCLAAYALKSCDTRPKSQIGVRVAIASTALFVNFPAALAIILTAMYLALQIQVTVVNQGPAIERFVVSGGCTETDFGAISPGATRVQKIRIECDGVLEFHMQRAGQELGGVIQRYVTTNDWESHQITFSPDGDWSVQDLNRIAD
jgi:hypothetical protein